MPRFATVRDLKNQTIALIRVNIHEAKKRFSRLVDLAPGREEIIITRSGKPVARLISYAAKGAVRRPGVCAARFKSKRTLCAVAE